MPNAQTRARRGRDGSDGNSCARWCGVRATTAWSRCQSGGCQNEVEVRESRC